MSRQSIHCLEKRIHILDKICDYYDVIMIHHISWQTFLKPINNILERFSGFQIQKEDKVCWGYLRIVVKVFNSCHTLEEIILFWWWQDWRDDPGLVKHETQSIHSHPQLPRIHSIYYIDTLLIMKIPLTFRSVVSLESKKPMNERKNDFIIYEKSRSWEKEVIM